jgi:hypothetical protein
VVSGCGKVAAQSDAASSDTASVVVDRNCADVKARLGTSMDGTYPIDPDGDGTQYKPFEVFCHAMDTATPTEYLVLQRTTQQPSQPSSNYATYVNTVAHGACTCGCGVITRLFSKVRIDPSTLVVDVMDRTFAEFADIGPITCVNSHPGCAWSDPQYALAASCEGEGDASGRANIDLRDMDFHVAGSDTTIFAMGGFRPGAGTALFDVDRKVVNLAGGGDSGWYGAPSSGLPLAQD